MSALTELIKSNYALRHLYYPTTEQAFLWHDTEQGEAAEIFLAKREWLRNHPEDHEPYSKERFAEELGDAIMMLVVAGIVEGVDPLDALRAKLERKIKEAQP